MPREPVKILKDKHEESAQSESDGPGMLCPYLAVLPPFRQAVHSAYHKYIAYITYIA
jgi:hypothetical protein